MDTNSPNYATHLEALERVLAADYRRSKGEALDAGCWAGCWSMVLAAHGFDVTGIDLSPNSAAWAKEKAVANPPQEPGSVAFHESSASESILGDLRGAGFTPVERWMTPISSGMLQAACQKERRE